MRSIVMLIGVLLWAGSAEARPFTPGNLLVTSGLYRQLREFTREGELVQTIEIPCGIDPCPIGQQPRDVVVDERGRAHVFNGTYQPLLSTYDPEQESWSHLGFPNWTLTGNTTYGGIAVLGRYVFVPSHGGAGGIIRFDVETGDAVAFVELVGPRAPRFTDLAIGPEGLLYALDSRAGGSVSIYDPFTLELSRTVFTTPETLRQIAVERSGAIVVLTDREDALLYDASGALLQRVPLGVFQMSDIDQAVDGTFAIASQFFEEVLLTNASLEKIGGFRVPAPARETFLAHVPTPLEIGIDVRPGDPTNTIPLWHGVVPVAVLGSETLDVRRIVEDSLSFGPGGASAFRPARLKDVDRDGAPDLLSLFRAADTGFRPEDTQACLQGVLVDGTHIQGCDPIHLRGCGPGFQAAILVPPVLWIARRRGKIRL